MSQPNRSAMATLVAPAKCIARSSSAPASTLIATRPLRANTSCIALPRLTQISAVGGESVTEQTAVTVMPHRPAGPSVVITFTAAGRLAMALRNSR